MSKKGFPKPNPSTLEDFYKHVPAEVREEIKGQILKAYISDMDGFIEATQYIIAQLLCGNIAPDVANSAKGYMELLFTAVSAKLIHEREAKNATPSNVMARVADAQRRGRKMIPRYTVDVDEAGAVTTEATLVGREDT